jgi:hypothetical protein
MSENKAKTATKLTESELVSIIQRTVKGTTVVSIDAVTEPKMNKTGNPYYGKVEKHCRMDGMIGFDYENSVNNQAKREGLAPDREAKPRQWGVLTADRLFVVHNGAYYLQMKCQSASDPIYKNRTTGEEIPVISLDRFLPARSSSSTQEGLEKEIVVRDVKLCNVKKIRMFGVEYEIVPEITHTDTLANVLA